MRKSVIKVSNLSKRYRLGLKEKQSETLIGQIGDLIKSPLHNLKRLREMNRFGDDDKSVYWALKNINFEVKEGEVLGIIGKNGAGKSTLLKILSQITDPTSGKIEIQGRIASLLEVGTGFHPELSGRENIYMNGTILGMTKREIDYKLDEIIDFSGVEKFIDTAVKFYSSGMKVRLGFSVAAHLEPEILIIDEVLAVGDYEFQKKCLGKMEDVSKKQGRSVLFVSHNLDAVSNLCDTAILLNDSKLIGIGDTRLIIDTYLNLSEVKTSLSKIVFKGPLSEYFTFLGLYLNKIDLLSEEVLLTKDSELEFNVLFNSKYSLEFKTILSVFKNGVKIFSVLDDTSYSRKTEDFIVSSKIQKGILSAGKYFISVGMHSKNDKWSWASEICSFTISNSSENNYDFRDFGVIDGASISKTIRI